MHVVIANITQTASLFKQPEDSIISCYLERAAPSLANFTLY